MSEHSAYEDYAAVRQYQRAHGGRLPGGSAEDMAALEAQDCQTLVEAMRGVGAHTYRFELATPVARLATWAYVDYLLDEAMQAGGLPVRYDPSMDMERARRIA